MQELLTGKGSTGQGQAQGASESALVPASLDARFREVRPASQDSL